jgi:hypothetical protein
MNKYHNRKVKTADGCIHDNRKEAVRWEILKRMEEEGKIVCLERQKEFLLIPPQYEDVTTGKRKKRKLVEKAVAYVADFVYQTENGEIVEEDTKGCKTRE